jgi:ABC-type transport system involved in multi-copper enzyme maturation permease subunit
MLAGPIFSREFQITPRQVTHFVTRAGYVAGLFVLMYTAGQATFGWQQSKSVGEVARFGGLLFQIFSFVQLSLVLFFAPLFAAGRVAQEKDRQTLILLLMTDLRDRELVFGKLLSSLLPVGVLLLASAPVFTLVSILGGITPGQIAGSLALCAATALAAGSWGTLVAFWREKTFQTLAISALGIVLFLGVIEAIVALAAGVPPLIRAVALVNPFRALVLVIDPLSSPGGVAVVVNHVVALLAIALLVNVVTVMRLRVWNPSRAAFEAAAARQQPIADATHAVGVPDLAGPPPEGGTPTTSAQPTREIWSNPVIWREIRTRAYGRRMIIIKLAYFVLCAFAVAFLVNVQQAGRASELILGMISAHGFAFVGLSLVGLMLINAQAVTSLTTERDGRTLELLLVTDISAREFVFGKLGGALYNAKETILIPLAGLTILAVRGVVEWENFVYLVLGFLLLAGFASMLGLHAGLSFDNSRAAIANSLGTMFFLFLGVFLCMLLIVEARSSFLLQLPSFMVFILGGSLGLWASLTYKNPSPALTLSALVLPFFTFYAITGFLLNDTLGIWAVVTATYGFTTLAMLIPAVSEFDVALGRTTLDKG